MTRPAGHEPATEPLHRGELSVMACGLFAVLAIMALRLHGSTAPVRVDRVTSGFVESIDIPRRVALSAGSLDTVHVVRLFVGWGTLALAAGLALAMAGLAWRRHDFWGAVLCLLAPPLAVALTDLLAKPVVGRYHESALAFPSGHATAAAAAGALVVVLFDRWRGWPYALRWAPAAAILPLVTGLGVVRLDWHYPTDVVGGVAMGAGVVIALAALAPASVRHH